MHNDDEKEGGEDQAHCAHCNHMDGPMKKEFKLAMLEKKEKMLKVKLEFIGKIKEIVAKMPESKE